VAEEIVTFRAPVGSDRLRATEMTVPNGLLHVYFFHWHLFYDSY